MRYLAIDHGQKRTGLAICDASETLVSPHSVIETQNSGVLVKRIVSVIEDEGIGAVVIGLPFNMDDTEGARVQTVREFAHALSGMINIPVFFHDERLSSFGAEHLAVDLDLTRKKKKKRLDAIAAAEILKGFLDARQNR